MSDKKQAIFDATKKLIAQHGIAGLSMKMVANAAGVAAGTIYRYFDNKDDLLRSLHIQLMHNAAENLLHNHDPKASMFEQYKLLWLNCCEHLLQDPDHFAYRAQFENSPYFNDAREQQIQEEIFAPIVALYEHGVESKVFKPLPIRLLVELSLGSAANTVKLHHQHELELTEELKQQVIEITWETICNRHPHTTQELGL
ncbi:TetR/AcrR family transcriptional regulator [Dongshaea marina]|uniref:TetR/AcrR family transcriptional regulator n=1 Tax=Dongshaea marina TaxID=2047966 RepID=UPI000D3E80EB|nr:TetR/AcrR family transcriptional regulator [Dongshaea marina]